jgi:hypothetical protein
LTARFNPRIENLHEILFCSPLNNIYNTTKFVSLQCQNYKI